ncbi:hypothetical protein [Mesorhizobium sp. ORM16]|uniref:hypothetical protein n=1 Tax=Mesorhizobium sp. ORM16 TaxID=3376989 RepID=UPI00385796C3
MAAALIALAFLLDFWPLFAARLVLGCGAGLMFIVAETALNTRRGARAARPDHGGLHRCRRTWFRVRSDSDRADARPSRRASPRLRRDSADGADPFRREKRRVSRAVAPGSARHILPAIAFPLAFGFSSSRRWLTLSPSASCWSSCSIAVDVSQAALLAIMGR